MRRQNVREPLLCRPLAVDDSATKKVQFIGFDITGGDIEYDILASQGPNTTLRKVSAACILMLMSGRMVCWPAGRWLGWHIKPANASDADVHVWHLMKLETDLVLCVQTYDTVIDDRCPQKKPFEVVRCIAHQHVGSEVGWLLCSAVPDQGDLWCVSDSNHICLL